MSAPEAGWPDRGHGECQDCQDDAEVGRARAWLRRHGRATYGALWLAAALATLVLLVRDDWAATGPALVAWFGGLLTRQVVADRPRRHAKRGDAT